METKTRRQSFKYGFIAGLAAGIIATGVMLILNQAVGGISLPEVFGSALTAIMPASMFDYLHQLIGGDAKHYLFYGILVGQCLVFGLSGAIYNVFYTAYYASKNAQVVGKQTSTSKDAPVVEKGSSISSSTSKNRFATKKQSSTKELGKAETTLQAPESMLQPYQGLVLAFALWLLVGFVFLPLTGSGIFGSQLSTGFDNTAVSLAVTGLVFGFFFVAIRNSLVTRARSARTSRTGRGKAESDLSRRTFVKRGIIIAGIALLGVGAWRFVTQGVNSVSTSNILKHFKSKIVPPPVPNYGVVEPARFLSPEITSNDQYYVVSKNLFSDPTVDGGSWRLTVDGQVEHPFTLTYQEVLALPMQQQYESMMCISNEVGGQYMSNALWEGIPLKDLLQRAGVKAGAIKIVFYAVDDYSDSIHLEKALEPTTLLAVRMNGAVLPDGHGFPVRMLVPGIYGMKHCKWLTRIEVVNQDYQGYWQQRGWDDAAPVRMTARIDTPLIGSNVSAKQLTYIAGVAFSGNKGISEVDVSLDEGNTWQLATLKRPLSGLTWVLWEYAWRPATTGNYTIIARAIDLEGNVQDPNVEPPAPIGSSGYHTINISVI